MDVLAWPGIAAVPAPTLPVGFWLREIGADKTVLDWDKVCGYFQAPGVSPANASNSKQLGKTADQSPGHHAATIAGCRHLEAPGSLHRHPAKAG